MTIASSRGHPSRRRRRGSTPGPQSSRSRPDWATRESSRRRGRARAYPRCNGRVLARRSAAVYNCAVAGASPDMLKKVPLFSGLDEKELQAIASSMRERKFRAGDTVTQEGAGGVGFFVVQEGEADVNVGGESKGTVGPGEYFGEIALINESPRTATLTARTDMVCYGMTPWDFRPLVETNSTIAWKLLTAMAEKMR